MCGRHRHCVAGSRLWCPVSGYLVSGRLQRGRGNGAWAVWQWPHPSLPETPHTVNKPHACNHHITHMQAASWPREGEGKGRRGGLWALPSHLALILPSPPSRNSFKYPAGPTLSPGVTAAATAAGGGGGVCAGKEGVISKAPLGLGSCGLRG